MKESMLLQFTEMCRELAETADSVIKRRYGDRVRSRKWHHQFREIIGKCIVYNIERAIKKFAPEDSGYHAKSVSTKRILGQRQFMKKGEK